MVPKGKSREKGESGRRARVPKTKSGKRTPKAKAARRSGNTASDHTPEVIDPGVAVVVKNPLRVHIIAVAFQRPISPSEFAREFDCPRWSASYHFKELARHGFLELVKTIPVRGATKHMYRATKRAYISSQDWRLVAPTVQPGIAGAALRDLTNRVSEALELGTFCARPDAYLLWDPLTLDEQAWGELVEMMAWTYDETKRLEAETVERRTKGKAEQCFPATFIIAGFESPTVKQVQAHARRKEKKRQAQGKGKRRTP